jgi:hypothetical protein
MIIRNHIGLQTHLPSAAPVFQDWAALCSTTHQAPSASADNVGAEQCEKVGPIRTTTCLGSGA